VSRRVPPLTAGPVPPLSPFGALRTDPPPRVAVPQPEPAPPPAPEPGPHPMELAALLHELSIRLLSADDLTQALDRLVTFAAGAIPGAVRCSVVLISDGEPLTRAAAGDRGEALDDLQYERGEGPGLESARTRAVVTASDLAADSRWPDLAGAARSGGVRAVAAVPLDVPRSSVGALSVYLAEDGAVGPELLIVTMAVVNQAEVLLDELRRREALSEGATVDRAVGVIIAQRGCGVHEAYDVLQETSQRLGMDRRAVAERLIAAAARRSEA
jgi:GAF domain-containing protein